MNTEIFCKVFDWVFPFLAHALTARALISMSSVSVIMSKNGPIPSEIVHDTNISIYLQVIYCIYTAMQNPNGFLQLNGNLCVVKSNWKFIIIFVCSKPNELHIYHVIIGSSKASAPKLVVKYTKRLTINLGNNKHMTVTFTMRKYTISLHFSISWLVLSYFPLNSAHSNS